MWVARVLRDLALLLLGSNGDLVAAAKLLRRVLAIDEKHHGPDHPYVASGLICLARVLGMLAEYAAAEPLYRRALAIIEKELGPEHPEVADALCNLADVLKKRHAWNS